MRLLLFCFAAAVAFFLGCHDLASNNPDKGISALTTPSETLASSPELSENSTDKNKFKGRNIEQELVGKWEMTGFNFPGTNKNLSDQINKSAGFQYWNFGTTNSFEMKMKLGAIIRGAYKFDQANENLILVINGVNASYRILQKDGNYMKVQSGSLGSIIEFQLISGK